MSNTIQFCRGDTGKTVECHNLTKKKVRTRSRGRKKTKFTYPLVLDFENNVFSPHLVTLRTAIIEAFLIAEFRLDILNHSRESLVQT